MDEEDYEDDVDDVDDKDDEDEDCQDDVDDDSYLILNILLQTPIPWQQKMLQQDRQFQVTLL